MGTEEMIAVELKDSHRLIGNVYMGKREFETKLAAALTRLSTTKSPVKLIQMS